MCFNKLPCNISMSVSSKSTSHLQLCSSFSRHLQFHWVLWHFILWASQPHKLIPLNFALKFFGNAHAHLPHFQNLLFTSTWGVVCTYKFILELTDPCWVEKMSRVHLFSFCNLIATTRCRHQKLTNFSHEWLSPPSIWEETARPYLMQWQLLNSGPDTPLTLP